MKYNILDKIDFLLNEISRENQLKLSLQKAKERKIEPKGNTNYQKSNFKHRTDLNKDRVKTAQKRLNYYDDEQKVKEKDKEKRKNKNKQGIFSRISQTINKIKGK